MELHISYILGECKVNQIRIMFEPSKDSELLQIHSLNDHQQQTT